MHATRSDSIGYGKTAYEAIRDLLSEEMDVIEVSPHPASPGMSEDQRALWWTFGSYLELLKTPLENVDCIFIFHIFLVTLAPVFFHHPLYLDSASLLSFARQKEGMVL